MLAIVIEVAVRCVVELMDDVSVVVMYAVLAKDVIVGSVVELIE